MPRPLSSIHHLWCRLLTVVGLATAVTTVVDVAASEEDAPSEVVEDSSQEEELPSLA